MNSNEGHEWAAWTAWPGNGPHRDVGVREMVGYAGAGVPTPAAGGAQPDGCAAPAEWLPEQIGHAGGGHPAPGCGRRLEVSQLGGAAILRVAGEFDTATAALLTAAVEELLAGDLAVLVVDLHDLTGLDDSGVTAFEALNDRARDRGTALRIIANNPAVLIPLMRGSAGRLDAWDTSGRLRPDTVRPEPDPT